MQLWDKWQCTFLWRDTSRMIKIKKHFCPCFFTFYLISIIFASCTGVVPTGPINGRTPTEKQLTIATSILKPTNIPTVTGTSNLKVIQVPTGTKAPKSSTPIPLSTNSLTFTIQPTFTSKVVEQMIMNLLKDNGACRLPCVWGFPLEETSPQFVPLFVERFGTNKGENKFEVSSRISIDSGVISSELWNQNTRVHIDFFYDIVASKLERVGIHSQIISETGQGNSMQSKPLYGDPFAKELLNYYTLPQILKNYGKPTQVYLYTFTDPEYENVSKIPFSIVIYYQESGFLVEYVVPRENSGDIYVGCPSKWAFISIVAWNTGNNTTLKEITQGNTTGYVLDKNSVDNFKPIEEVTTMTLDTFYEKYHSPTNETCILTQRDFWPKP
jgi:hypothetical protein